MKNKHEIMANQIDDYLSEMEPKREDQRRKEIEQMEREKIAYEKAMERAVAIRNEIHKKICKGVDEFVNKLLTNKLL